MRTPLYPADSIAPRRAVVIPSGLPEFAEGDRAASRFELRDLCQGTGTWSDVINGVNFVTWHRGQPAQQGYPAVANMSLSGDTNRAVEAAVRNSIGRV